VVSLGHLPRTGETSVLELAGKGRRQLAVTGIQDGIPLNITKHQVENFPPMDLEHPG
jgi:hypothetical protein